jgi:hypothetical protein
MLSAITAHAGTGFEVGATVDPMSSLRNPVSGMAAVRLYDTRIGATLGNNERLSVAIDLLRISSRSGISVGIGVVSDRLTDEDFSSSESSNDTTVTRRPHDSGLHRGDRHVRNGKVVTSLRSFSRSLSLFGQDWGLSSSFFVSIPLPARGFIESRVLFTAGEVSNRTSIGVRL